MEWMYGHYIVHIMFGRPGRKKKNAYVSMFFIDSMLKQNFD